MFCFKITITNPSHFNITNTFLWKIKDAFSVCLKKTFVLPKFQPALNKLGIGSDFSLSRPIKNKNNIFLQRK